jgi:hypothetical protein
MKERKEQGTLPVGENPSRKKMAGEPYNVG